MKTHKQYCWTMVVAAMMFTGCASKVAPQEGAVERARVINTLEEQNEALIQRIAELESQISNVVNEHSSEGRVDAPLPVPVVIGFASGCEVRAGDESETIIRLKTLDARGRFLQMTGPLNIVIAVIDEEGVPRQLADIDVGSNLFPDLFPTISKPFPNLFQTSSKQLPNSFQTFARPLPNLFQTSSKPFPNLFQTSS